MSVPPSKIWLNQAGQGGTWYGHVEAKGGDAVFYHIPDERVVQLKNTKSVLMRELKDYPDADHTTHMALVIALREVDAFLAIIDGKDA